MKQKRIAQLTKIAAGFALLLLPVAPAWAGTYKCLQPDGAISYQERPCEDDSAGGAGTSPGTLAAQAQTSERGRRGTLDERRMREGLAVAERGEASDADDYDAVKCAKHREEAANWRLAAQGSHRDQDEREQQAQMIKHHEALVEHYCAPRP